MNLDLSGFEAPSPRQPSRWEAFAVLITALATLAVVVTGAKPYVQALLAAATVLIAAGLWYSPLVTFACEKRAHARRDRIARKSWPEFLRLERRFAAFVNTNDSSNLRGIISAICSSNPQNVAKLSPPDYIDTFFPLISERHNGVKRVSEQEFRQCVLEFCATVGSFNREYVLGPLKRIAESSVFMTLPASTRDYHEKGIEDFRERWVRLLDDLKEFVERLNGEFKYEPYHQAMNAYFERPRKFSRPVELEGRQS